MGKPQGRGQRPEELRLLNIGGSEEVQEHQIVGPLGRWNLKAAGREA